MIVMTAATRQEAEAIAGCLENRQRIDNNGFLAWRGTRGQTNVLAVQTGMGKQRVENSLGAFLAVHPATAVISLGFGGALTRELRSGDLVICATTISLNEPGGGSETSRYHADEQLVRRAAGLLKTGGTRWILGKGVTVLRVVSDAAVKQGLRDRSEAEVCEMEDYWVSRMAGARGIPFLAVRVIYDEFGAALPGYEKLVEPDGNTRAFRAMTHFMAHPGQILKSGGYFLNYRSAKASLSKFVAEFLATWER